MTDEQQSPTIEEFLEDLAPRYGARVAIRRTEEWYKERPSMGLAGRGSVTMYFGSGYERVAEVHLGPKREVKAVLPNPTLPWKHVRPIQETCAALGVIVE